MTIIQNFFQGGYTFDLTCQFDPGDLKRKQRCVSYVNDIKADMERISLKHGGEHLHQYYNTPSCNALDKEPPFQERWVSKPCRC